MRVADLWPAITWPGGDSATLLRDVDSLTSEEWGELISNFDTLGQTYDDAASKATLLWAARFPAEHALEPGLIESGMAELRAEGLAV